MDIIRYALLFYFNFKAGEKVGFSKTETKRQHSKQSADKIRDRKGKDPIKLQKVSEWNERVLWAAL